MAKVPPQVSEYMRTIGSRGGSSSSGKPKGLAALSDEERRRIAKQGAKAMWAKKWAKRRKKKG